MHIMNKIIIIILFNR